MFAKAVIRDQGGMKVLARVEDESQHNTSVDKGISQASGPKVIQDSL